MKVATENGVEVPDGIKVEVDAMDLQKLLLGLLDRSGIPVREWQATYDFDRQRNADHNPIVNLVHQYNDWVAQKHKEQENAKSDS